MGLFTAEYNNESFEPEKIYTKKIIEAEIVPGDEKYIEKFLFGEKSNIGNYEVIKYLGRPKNRWKYRTNKRKDQITWRIRCNCGLEKDISHSNFNCLRYQIRKNNIKPHCNCPKHKKEFELNTEYDLLKIVGYAKLTAENANRQSNHIAKGIWKAWYLACSCKCGKYDKENPFYLRPHAITRTLKEGRTSFGCGCKQKKHGMRDSDAYSRLSNAKIRAKKKNLAFDLDIYDCIAPKNCPVLGIPLKVSTKKGPTDNSPNLDRLIGSKGYTKNNVVIISNKANRIKNSATIHQLRLVANWLKEQVTEN